MPLKVKIGTEVDFMLQASRFRLALSGGLHSVYPA
jgi:hypothetical protein